jgi:thymidylate synthase
MLWFLGAYDEKYKKFGKSNIKYLVDPDKAGGAISFWNEWPYENYKKNYLDKYKQNDLIDEFRIKKYKLLSIKEYVKKIIDDDDFALKWGDLGPVYPSLWQDFNSYDEQVEKTSTYNATKSGARMVTHEGWQKIHMDGINQIDNVIDLLLNDPDSRRILVSAWNPSELDSQLLPPCHVLFQFASFAMSDEKKLKHPGKQKKLSLQVYQRSCDYFLGWPFNIAEYSVLLHMIAQVVDMVPDELIWTGGDVHLYSNSIDAAKEILRRESLSNPKINLNPDITDIYDFRFDDIEISDYEAHPNIKVEVAV